MIQLVLQWIEFAELWLAYFWRQQRQEPFFTLVIHCQHNRSCYNCMYYYAVLQNFWILVNHKAEVLITYVCSWRTYLQWLRSHQKILFKLCRVVPVWLAFVDITDKSTFETSITTKQNLLRLWSAVEPSTRGSSTSAICPSRQVPAAVYRRSSVVFCRYYLTGDHAGMDGLFPAALNPIQISWSWSGGLGPAVIATCQAQRAILIYLKILSTGNLDWF